jgi:hypothetical protein
MVDRPTPDIRQIRARLLPELIFVVAFPYLIFRLAIPYMPATYALLLAGIPPAIRLALGLVRQRRIDLLGMFSLLAIVISIFSGLVLKDTRLQFASGSLVTGVYGVIMLASLLTPRPLILRLAESALVGNDPVQRQRFRTRLQQSSGFRAFFTYITALWGAGLLLEFVVRIILVYTLTIEQFLLVSSLLRYGFLGVLLLLTLLFANIQRRRQGHALEQEASQQTQETSGTPV